MEDTRNLRFRFAGVKNVTQESAFDIGRNHPEVNGWENEKFEGDLQISLEDEDVVNLRVKICPANPEGCPYRYSWRTRRETPYKGCNAVDLPDGFYWRKYYKEGKALGSSFCKEQ